jgi:hypothetical protein
MPLRVTVTVQTRGAEKLARVGAAVKAAGDKDLRRELLRAAQRCGRPMKDAARKGALERLPKSGGLAERVATSKFSVRTRTTGRGAGVRIVGTSGYDLDGIDQGVVRHPTYGHKPWKDQPVRPGWFTDAETDAAPKFRDEFDQAVNDVGRHLEAQI